MIVYVTTYEHIFCIYVECIGRQDDCVCYYIYVDTVELLYIKTLSNIRMACIAPNIRIMYILTPEMRTPFYYYIFMSKECL